MQARTMSCVLEFPNKTTLVFYVAIVVLIYVGGYG